MKKVRLSLKRGAKSWSFQLFDSAEAAYYLRGPQKTGDSEYRQTLDIIPGSYMEIEWLGVEYIYEKVDDQNQWHESFDRVRIAKYIKAGKGTPPEAGGKDYIELAMGWVHGGSIPWLSDTHDKLKIIKINKESASKLNFDLLFDGVWREDDDMGLLSGSVGDVPTGMC